MFSGGDDKSTDNEIEFPQFHEKDEIESDSSEGSTPRESHNFIVLAAKPSDVELTSLERNKYVLINSGENNWEVYYVGTKGGKNVLDPPAVPTMTDKLKNILPANANSINSDLAKKIDETIKNEQVEYKLIELCEEFFRTEREFHKVMNRFVRDAEIVYGSLRMRKKNEVNVFLDRYRALEKNHFPESVDVSESKSTQEKIEKNLSAMLEVMGKSKEFKDSYLILKEATSNYEEFQSDWLNLSDKAFDAVTVKGFYKDLLKAKQQFLNDAATPFQHGIKMLNLLKEMSANFNKRYPESPIAKDLNNQELALKEIESRVNDDKNFMLRTGILGKIQSAIVTIEERSKNIDSDSRKFFKEFKANIIVKMREMQKYNISPDHLASFIFADFVKTYVTAYIHAGKNKDFITLLQRFIIEVDTYLADINIRQVIGAQNKNDGEVDKLIFGMLKKKSQLENRIENGESEYLRSDDKSISAAKIQEKRAEEFRSGLVRFLFNEAKLALGEQVEDKESGEIMKEVADTEAKKIIFVNTKNAIVNMGRDCIEQWNTIADAEYLELKISPNAIEMARKEQEDAFKKLSGLGKSEKDRAKALVDFVIKTFDSEVKTQDLSSEHKKAFSEFRKRMQDIDIESQTRTEVRNQLQHILIDINAYAYKAGREKKQKVSNLFIPISVAGPILERSENFIRKVDTELEKQGQEPLLVPDLRKLGTDPIENAALIFSLLPKILGDQFSNYIKRLYLDIKNELKKIEPLMNAWIQKVDALSTEKKNAENIIDKKIKKQELSKISDKFDLLDKEFDSMCFSKGGPIYVIRMELVNTLKMIERINSEQAKVIWNQAFENDPELSTLLGYRPAMLISQGYVLKEGENEIAEKRVKGVFDSIIEQERKERMDFLGITRKADSTRSSRLSFYSPQDTQGARRGSTISKIPLTIQESQDEGANKHKSPTLHKGSHED